MQTRIRKKIWFISDFLKRKKSWIFRTFSASFSFLVFCESIGISLSIKIIIITFSSFYFDFLFSRSKDSTHRSMHYSWSRLGKGRSNDVSSWQKIKSSFHPLSKKTRLLSINTFHLHCSYRNSRSGHCWHIHFNGCRIFLKPFFIFIVWIPINKDSIPYRKNEKSNNNSHCCYKKRNKSQIFYFVCILLTGAWSPVIFKSSINSKNCPSPKSSQSI